MANEKSITKILAFYSYAHKDVKLRDQLSISLSPLKRSGALEEWYDRKIAAGDEWADEIAQQLDAANLILLLVSPDFIASDYCYGKEMTRALARNNKRQARVVPIIIRPCDFSGAPFAKLQALPKDAKPVTLWGNRDKAWLDVLQGLSQTIKEIAAGVASQQTSGGRSIVRSVDRASPRSANGRRKKHPKATTRSKRAKSSKPATVAAVRKLGRRAAARPGGYLERVIYDARNTETLPGKVVRREGAAPKGDAAVDEAYEWLGVTYHFFWDVFKRNSVDGKGMPLKATVHYGKKFSNAFWNGKHMIIGDGDGDLFERFTKPLDVVGKEFTNGVVQHDTKLTYWEQSGALFNSIACILAVLVKQYALKQTAAKADWLHGAGLFAPGVNGKAISSLAKPGTAYNDKRMGKDPQPDHMHGYVKTSSDSGGIHINTGIPNHAFYQIATALGGYSWEKAGRIWYDAMRDKQLKANAQFSDFARITLQHANKLFGPRSVEAAAVKEGWGKVGVKPGR